MSLKLLVNMFHEHTFWDTLVQASSEISGHAFFGEVLHGRCPYPF